MAVTKKSAQFGIPPKAAEQDNTPLSATYVGTRDKRRVFAIRARKGSDVAARVKAAQTRLNDIHARLELAIKCGLVSDSIH